MTPTQRAYTLAIFAFLILLVGCVIYQLYFYTPGPARVDYDTLQYGY